MSPRRRTFLTAAGALSLAPSVLRAQTPLPPVRILVGFAAGGAVDVVARAIADAMRPLLARNVIVENKPGAAGRLVLEAVRAAPPDGDTLMMVPHGPMTLFKWLYRQLRYDPVTDFAPVGRVCVIDYALATGAGTSAHTLADYIAWARRPGSRAAFGSPGAGTVPHFLGQGFGQRAGIDLTHIGYKGSAPAMVDLMGGSISMVVSPLSDSIEQHRAGKVRILATTGSQRNPDLDGVPTLRDASIDLAIDGWIGLYAPAKTPDGRVQDLFEALRVAVAANEATFRRLTIRPLVAGPHELSRLQQAEAEQWGPLVRASGFTPES